MNKLDIIKSFEEKKILLIGETILDVYLFGKGVCKALDAPAIEAEETEVKVYFGGASSVANNILELGGNLVYISLVGDDENAQKYGAFQHPKLKKCFLTENSRKTIVKKRFLVDGYKSLQMNQVDNRNITPELEKKIIELLEFNLGGVDLILISDFQHGLLTKNLISQIINFSKKYQKPVYIDSQIAHKGSNYHFYRGADCVFLNQREAQAVNANFNIEKAEPSLNAIKEKLGIANVAVKLGERGSISLFGDKIIKSLPYTVKAVDTCGAGDAFLAAFSLGNPKLPEESLEIANVWAALSTTVWGTNPPKKEDFLKIYHG